MAEKVCTGCGETKDEREFRWHGSTKSGRTRYQRCGSCDRVDSKKYHDEHRSELLAKMRARRISERSTLEGFLRYLLRAKRDWCRSRNVACTITLEFLLETYEAQNGLCPLSGRVLEYGPGKRTENRLSLDRIESCYGYVPGNIRLVMLHGNIGRSEYGDRALLVMAYDVIRTYERGGDPSLPPHLRSIAQPWDWNPRVVALANGAVELVPRPVWLKAVGLDENSHATTWEICSAIALQIGKRRFW